MEYTLLGATGPKVSRIALGCMSFGTPFPGMGWTLDEDAAQPFFAQAVDLGVTFWDTANAYGGGTSEVIVGRAITKYATRSWPQSCPAPPNRTTSPTPSPPWTSPSPTRS